VTINYINNFFQKTWYVLSAEME